MDHNQSGLRPVHRTTAHPISIPSGLVLGMLHDAQELSASAATIRSTFPGNALLLEQVSARLRFIAETANQ